jgi:protein NirF
MNVRSILPFLAPIALALVAGCAQAPLRGTADLGVVIERAGGAVSIVDTSQRSVLAQVQGLGDMSHASVCYSRDGRYAYVFGRDGGLTKIDLLTAQIVKRVVQAGNSIGGAISQDGTLIAVSNYTPGGVKVFAADTLEQLADIPAVTDASGARSKVVGLVDAPGHRFVFSLFEAGEIWVADLSTPRAPQLHKFPGVGREPYDAMITADGRYYAAGLFGEDGVALLDLWHLDAGVRRVLDGYGKSGVDPKLPVYKMPHLEGWALTGNELFLPAVGHHEVIVADASSWREIAHIPVHGQPVFVVARPDARQVWVNFAFPDNDVVQVIDVPTRRVVRELRPGKAVLHLEFTPRGEHVWVSARDSDRVVVYDTDTFEDLGQLAVRQPSGIFFTARAHRIGQ